MLGSHDGGIVMGGEMQHVNVLKGNLGQKQSSYGSLAESRFNASSDRKQKRNMQRQRASNLKGEGVISAASLMWNAEDEMNTKMQAKLASTQNSGNVQSDPNLQPSHSNVDSATAFNTQKLKDIAR